MKRSYFGAFRVKLSPTNVHFVTTRFHALFFLDPVCITLNISSSATGFTFGMGHRKLHGRRFDAEERERKRDARLAHKRSEFAQKVHGLRAKLYNQRRFKEKATMRKTIAQHNERSNKHANDEAVADGAVPAYLLDREGVSRAKVLSNTVKQKRKEKTGKWEVPNLRPQN
jgi:hypothetical protein